MIDFIIIAYVSTKCKGYSGEIEGILLDYNTSCTPKIKKKNVRECGKIRLL